MKRAFFLSLIFWGCIIVPTAIGQDTAYVNRLNTEAWFQRESDPDSAALLARQAIKASESGPYLYGMANAYVTMGFVACSRKESIGFDHFREAIRLRRQNRDSCGVANVYTLIASFNLTAGDYAKALEYCNLAINIAKDFNAPAYGNLGYEQRLRNLASAYFARAEVFQAQNINDQSIADVRKGYSSLLQTKLLTDTLEAELKLAEQFYYLMDTAIYADSAALYFRKVLDHIRQEKADSWLDPYNIAFIQHNLAVILMDRKNPAHAAEIWELLDRSDSLFAGLESPDDSIGWCYTAIARGNWMNLYQQDTLRSIRYYERALTYHFDLIEPEKQLELYYNLAAAYRYAGKGTLAYDFFNRAYHLQDSLRNESVDRKISDLRQKQHDIETYRNTLALREQKLNTQKQTLISSWLAVVLVAIVLIFGYYMWQIRRKREAMFQRMKTVTQQFLEEVQQEERRTLGNELHGEIASPLASLAWVAETMLAKTSKDADEYHLIELLHRRLKERAEYVRDKSHDLRFKPSIEQESSMHLDLKKYISALCDIISMTGKIRAEYEIKADNPPPHIKFHLGQVIEELVNNTLKHSRAHKITIRLEQKAETLFLHYTDDGVGFQNNEKEVGIGLEDIRRRIASVNGKIISMGNHPSGGIEVTISIPIAEAQH